MRRAVLATLVAGAATAAVVLAASVALALELLRCYSGVLPLPDQPICGSGLWGHEAVPGGLLAITAAMVAASGWCAVAALRTQFVGASMLLRRLLAAAIPAPPGLLAAADALGIPRIVYVRLDTATAFTVGVFRPRVIVSDSLVRLLTAEELEAVLVHEREHQRRRDPAAFGLARTVARANFVVPMFGHLADRLVLSAETAADAAAVRQSGTRTLVAALAKLSSDAAEPDAALGSVRGMLEERVLTLAGRPVTTPVAVRVRVASLAGLAAVLLPAGAVVAAYLRVRGVVA